jgi:hypothetical protein
MREDKAEYSPSGSNDEEEYNEDEDELESGEFNSHILQMTLSPKFWFSIPTQIVFT